MSIFRLLYDLFLLGKKKPLFWNNFRFLYPWYIDLKLETSVRVTITRTGDFIRLLLVSPDVPLCARCRPGPSARCRLLSLSWSVTAPPGFPCFHDFVWGGLVRSFVEAAFGLGQPDGSVWWGGGLGGLGKGPPRSGALLAPRQVPGSSVACPDGLTPVPQWRWWRPGFPAVSYSFPLQALKPVTESSLSSASQRTEAHTCILWNSP